ncbi:MAG: PD-(D/E)XK nuclease family protein [Wenzhouxiangella sp.]
MSDGETLILTPTARLARAEIQRLAGQQVAAGAAAWRAPQVLAFSSWLQRLREDYFLHAEDARVPISAEQALLLWQSVIDRDVFVGEPRVAELAAGAWRLIHEHSLTPPERWPAALLSEDARAMRDWAERFRARLAEGNWVDEWTFAAELSERIQSGQIALPARIRLQGFELSPAPLVGAVLDAVAACGVDLDGHSLEDSSPPSWPIRVCAQAEDELRAAAEWARARLEHQPQARLAIVVPDLNGRVGEAERAFRQVFDAPGFALDPRGAEPWHISLGLPLAQWPIVADALLLLGADPQRMAHPDAIRLSRSPFLDGAPDESRARARLLTQLAERVPYWLDARELAYRAGKVGAERLGRRLTAWQRIRQDQPRRAMPSNWARVFSEELVSVGYAHGRPLDSREFQTWRRWQEVLEGFGTLDAVSDKVITRGRALKLLRERAAAVVFRERDPGAPVEILGVEEALGSRFDALWVLSLDQAHWPAARQAHPLIPPAVQREVPAASNEGCLARAKAQLAGLARCAPELIGSFARGDEDAQLSLLVHPAGEVIEVLSEPADEAAKLEVLQDDIIGPRAPAEARGGGTGLLQRQSDCPFKAFAVDRLAARQRGAPRPGLSPAQRGQLVHAALRQIWTEIDSLAALQALSPETRRQTVETAVDQALEELIRFDRLALSASSRRLEAACLAQTLDDWLSLESSREPFQVVGREQPIELNIGGLALKGTIDRIDELEGGGSVLIDYKTGSSSRAADWQPGARLADVQLPAYAVSLRSAPVAVSFAKVRADSQSFAGLAEVDPGMPGVKALAAAGKQWSELPSWADLLAAWRDSLAGLAADFLAGQAAVAPREAKVCGRCHLSALCRIHERALLEEIDDE